MIFKPIAIVLSLTLAIAAAIGMVYVIGQHGPRAMIIACGVAAVLGCMALLFAIKEILGAALTVLLIGIGALLLLSVVFGRPLGLW